MVAKANHARYDEVVMGEVPFDRLVHCWPDGLVLLDRSGFVQYMNPAAEKLTDFPILEARGRHWKEVFTIRVEDPGDDQTGSLIQILLERPILESRSGRMIPIELQISHLTDAQGNSIGSMLILHDITDLNREKEGLKESRAKYKHLVNAIEGIVWEADAKPIKFRFVSDYAEKLLGYSPKNWLKDPGFWKKIIHPDDLSSVEDIQSQSLQQNEDYHIEYRVTAADGRLLLVRDTVTIARDGGRARLSGIMTDITEAKRARDALIKSEELFSAAFYSNPVPLLLLTEAGKILDANESYERMTGLFHDELIDRFVFETGLCTAAEYESIAKSMLERTRVPDLKLTLKTAAGLTHSADAAFQRIALSGEPCFLAVFRSKDA